uniref:Eukaryotic translation initiation factor 3 subunit G n=1 Tax=Mucochytrium quahogii TaxID=96639 RepID=A0A7S2S8B5_9STRA|mmetsp:Transcript_7242/g.11558  ORF Transcript_7242/g.11558 Transcript_7242/m.11558 type:complete len:318 (-) Transcript_7242:1604-2557(-)|eukprot:CAMPEP_0203757648 /NCGR_PEP_ID=MMETSP0098-20131031/10613_1 /ASSEMBLY_ACC=CAM_ASM_000208 /TAXON_ID=96639 /ORGANISM=" , Strain NY0313808BC1" /LENGTH=317 /DNA_ID=CAMNT_0050649875 /DNA_START=119 /DNA_END=1072 /DNA_ORIENTATION=+
MEFRGGWADDDDDFTATEGREDSLSLPEPSWSGPDKHGVKTYTSYRIVDGRKEKVVQKIKMVTRKKKVSKSVQMRRQLPKFGLSLGKGPGPEEETTIVSRDEFRIESPGQEAKAAKKEEEELIKRLREGRAKRQFAQAMDEKKAGISQQFGMGGEEKKGGLRTGTALSEAMANKTAGDPGAGGKYVPMHLRAGAQPTSSGGRFDDGEQNTLRVTNISEDTTEDDLRELFLPFGRVQRVYLAKDRETQQSRGFAYISFYSREHAERALDKLNGFGYDHLILKVEWAKPSTKDDAGSQSVMHKGIVSGYGGALPQGLGK